MTSLLHLEGLDPGPESPPHVPGAQHHLRGHDPGPGIAGHILDQGATPIHDAITVPDTGAALDLALHAAGDILGAEAVPIRLDVMMVVTMVIMMTAMNTIEVTAGHQCQIVAGMWAIGKTHLQVDVLVSLA